MSNPLAASPGSNVLGVLLTSKCNISCRHCCNDSHPLQSGAVGFEDVAELIESARDIPSIREIGLSGGEPFLFIPLLRRVIQFAASLGFTSSVTTNGYWARSSEALRLLQDLQANGLRAINLSTSVFHQEFIQLKTVVSAASTALLAGLKVTINLVSTSTFSRDTILAELGELVDTVQVVTMPCLPAGRGVTGVRNDEFVPEFEIPHGNCRDHFKKMAVDISGNVYPCCSLGGFTAPLMMGNVRNASLGSIVDASANSKLLAILESVGPSFFLPFLRAAAVAPSLSERFSDQCHLCHEMLSASKCQETIRAASEQLFSELVAVPSAETSVDGDRLEELIERMRASAAHA